MSDAEDSDQGELMPSESSHSSNDGKGTGEKEAGHLNGQGVLSSVEGICDDGICRSDQLPTLLPKMDAPSTPSNSNSALGTPSHQYTHIPGREGGATPTPIQPYLQYYPGMMPGFSAPLQADALLTGANSNPYNYADVSNLSDPIPDTRRNRGGVTEPFPEKLHRMLEQTERDGLTDVVSFFTHGRAFAIHKPKRFQTEIMPTYFKQTRLTSFQRQLNLYGFRRISQGPDNGGYYHELFLKGRPGLCVNLKRTKVKGSQKIKRDPDTEPNFYSYPPIKPQVGTMIPAHAMMPPHMQQVAHGQYIPASPPTVVYPGYGYPSVPFQGYPGHSMQQLGPYTAAQQPAPSPSPQAPAMYGYPAYYPYPTWYPMPTTMTSPMSAITPVRGTKSDDSAKGMEPVATSDVGAASTSLAV